MFHGGPMAKPKAKTLQERMGFTDPDLKTPGHDAIMLYLDGQVKDSLARWLDLKWTDADQTHGLDLPAIPQVKVTRTIWERPVTTGRNNDFTVGFLDLAVAYQCQGVGYTEAWGGQPRKYRVSWYDDEAF